MGIIFVIVAAMLTSFSNLCLRRSIDAGGSSKAYLVVQLAISFLLMIVLNPVWQRDFVIEWGAIYLGLTGGLLFGVFMWAMGKTLETGPPGLSLAILNASSLAPALLLFALFGTLYGHGYTWWNGLGSLLVLIGIFWASATAGQMNSKKMWLFFVSLIFVLHTLFLVFLQWWAMVINPELPTNKWLPFHINSSHLAWFMPSVLFAASLFHLILYLQQRLPVPSKTEVSYAFWGGITNGGCTFLLIMAPQIAQAWENAMIFPIFSVSIILFCNSWAKVIYKEKVNVRAITLCVAGILIGTIAWSQFF